MSQNVKVYRTLEFYAQGGATRMSTIDTDDSATILYWKPETDDTGYLAIGDGTKDMDVKWFGGTANDYILFDVGNKSLTLAGAMTATVSGDVTLAAAADLVLDTGTGSKFATSTAQKLGFWNATPVVRPTAYTQTYTTATGTHSNLTSATLTDNSTGTATGTIAALGTAGTALIPVAYNDAIASLASQCNALRVDLANSRQVLNQVIDNLQTIGLFG